MKTVSYVLITDGPSDVLLLSVLNWLLRQYGCDAHGDWFDPRAYPAPPRTLANRICQGCEAFPSDVVFVHRDAERQPPARRREEIRVAIEEAAVSDTYVCVVPVRMTEAWFLFDEAAIRRAAGVPSGRVPLELPPVRRLEQVTDPKAVLHQALRVACELSGRRLKRFRLMPAKHRLSEALADFSPLRVLPAFQQLEADIVQFLNRVGGAGPHRSPAEGHPRA